MSRILQFYTPHLWWRWWRCSDAGTYFGGCLYSRTLFQRETENDEWLRRSFRVEKPKRSALLSLVALCPWRGIGWRAPCPFCFFTVIIWQRDTRNVCNAWKIHPFFSGDIIDVLLWALQQNATECDGSIYEIMFCSFCFCWWTMSSARCLIFAAAWSGASLALLAYDA